MFFLHFQYMYTFVIKYWALVKEDLLLTFTRMTIIMISVMIGLLHFFSPGKQSVSYYICLGEDPSIDPYDYGKVRIQKSVLRDSKILQISIFRFLGQF